MLAEILPSNLFAFFLVFARVGSAVMLLPGFGESYVSTRIRLLFALVLALAVTPVVEPHLPQLPSTVVQLFAALGGEIMVGLFIGSLASIAFMALNTAGSIIAYQSSLANALVFDVAAAQQGALVGAFLTTLGVLAGFVSDLHHVALRAVVESYTVFPSGQLPMIGDMAEAIARVVSESFLIAVQFAAPILVLGLVFYLGVGLLARLMPQVQIFFVVQPLQIVLGLLVLLLTVGVGLALFLDRFANVLTNFTGAS
ncbi:MAG TPA: flagellar biosynthetic protein FliR [Alphaproteobacteria bacterium]